MKAIFWSIELVLISIFSKNTVNNLVTINPI